jgi:hypothetical protein
VRFVLLGEKKWVRETRMDPWKRTKARERHKQRKRTRDRWNENDKARKRHKKKRMRMTKTYNLGRFQSSRQRESVRCRD